MKSGSGIRLSLSVLAALRRPPRGIMPCAERKCSFHF